MLSGAEQALAHNGQIASALPLEGITIDGQLDDWPADGSRYRIDLQFQDGGEPLTGPEDHEAYFRLGYSIQENALYAAVEVADDFVVIDAQDPEHRWDTQDGCEIYLSLQHAEADALPVQYYQWGDVSGVHPSERGDVRDFSVAQHWGDKGYTFEWRVDIGRVSDGAFRLAPGAVVGFDITLWDRDADGSRTWMLWGDTPVNTGSKFMSIGDVGDLVLTRADQVGEIRAQVQTKGPVGTDPFAGAWYELWLDSTQVLVGLIDGDGMIRQRVPAGSYRLRGGKRGYRTSVAPLQVIAGQSTTAGFVLEDPGSCFYVDDDAPFSGDGTRARPFRTIQQGLTATSYGDTVRLAAGTYSEPVELISGVTILGAGLEQTRVGGEAHWGLALRPFIVYYERGEEELSGVYVPDVTFAGFILDGGDRYPSRPARDVSDLLAAVTAIGHNWRLETLPTSKDVADIRALLKRNPGLATARIVAPDAYEQGSTLLHRVVRGYVDASDAEYEIARLLIENGADVNVRGGQARGSGWTVLGNASFFANPRLVELYLAHGGVPDDEVMDETAHEGAHVDDPAYIATLDALIEGGGRYHLGHLIMVGHIDRIKAELDRDPGLVHAEIDLLHDSGHRGTPLHEAADDCDGRIAGLLLDRGADINALDNQGRTPLQRAFIEGRCGSDFIHLLLDRGAQLDLLSAAVVGEVDLVRELLETDPEEIHATRPDGWSALDLAAAHGHADLVQVLRAAGATFSQNVAAMLDQVPPDHRVHKLLEHSAWPETELGYMHLEPAPSLDLTEQITIAAWVYLLTGEMGTILSKWAGDFRTESFVLHTGPDAGFYLRWEDGIKSRVTDFSLPYLQWVHYAATYDGTNMKVYLNGEVVAERTEPGKRIAVTDIPVMIGSGGYRHPLPGLIDDVQLWNVARTQEQIQQSMREGLIGDEPGLVGWWPLDDQPLMDRSPQGNHGRFEGAAHMQTKDVPTDAGHAPEQVLWLRLPAK